MTNKTCESCGMPMKEVTDFGGNNPESKYCRHCTDENGNLQDFEIRLTGMTKFISSKMNVDEETAEKIAKENMGKMPAWEKYFK
jgi:hypothetical protein